MFAGAFARRPGVEIPTELKTTLRSSLSRHPGEDIAVFDQRRGFLVHADVGAYGCPGTHTCEGGAATVLAGDPLLGVEARPADRTRTDDLALLHASLRRGDSTPLALAKEAFALAHLDPAEQRLVLATDRIGLRPVYYWIGENLVVYATALRVLEQCAVIPKSIDFGGYCEHTALRVTLRGRTPYAQIRRLRAAEVLTVTDTGESFRTYWRWDAIRESDEPVDVLAARAHATLDEAIRLRLRGDDRVAALLSGGLDSRTIIAMLSERGADLHTLNLRVPGPERADNSLSRAYADVAGTRHQELPLPSKPPSNMSGVIRRLWDRIDWTRDEGVAHPQLVWHGFDGSFSIGYVHVYPESIAKLRAGDVDGAFKFYLQKRGAAMWTRGMRAPYAAAARAMILDAMKSAYGELACDDPGRQFYVYHLVEECRSLLQSLYENADLRRLEFHLPLVDPDVLAIVISVPPDAAVGHGFYMRMLEHVSPETLSVPWQTYPGHRECPLPTNGRVDQWGEWKTWRRVQRRAGSQAARRVLKGGRFPSAVFKRSMFCAALALHHLRRGNYEYAFRDIEEFQRLARFTDGDVRL